MKKYLIDVNLPYYFSLWNSDDYIHLKDVNDEWTDDQIWNYAESNNLTIISKDSDFSDKILYKNPPPKIIHIKFGNLKMKEFFNIISNFWDDIQKLNEQYKLVNVFKDRIEGIN